MAGPGKRGDKGDNPVDDIALSQQYLKVIGLALNNLSPREISAETGYSERHVRRIIFSERARQLSKKPLADLRGKIWAQAEEMREALRPAITGDPISEDAFIPSEKAVASMVSVLMVQLRLVGPVPPPLPAATTTAAETPEDREENQQSKEERDRFLEDLPRYQRTQEAIEAGTHAFVDGNLVNPPIDLATGSEGPIVPLRLRRSFRPWQLRQSAPVTNRLNVSRCRALRSGLQILSRYSGRTLGWPL